MTTFFSGPMIAALTGRHRMTVNNLMRLGRYGATTVVAGVRFAAIDAVERRHGLKFTDVQIEAAAAGLPGRVIRIPAPEEAA
jgi:hypothetical protein